MILRGHAGCVKALNFSQHAKGLASGSTAGEVMIWSPLGKLEINLKPCGFVVCAVSYSPDGMSLAVGGTEGQCRIYSIGTGVCILAIQCDPGPGSIRSVAFSPAGTLLATGSDDGNMSIFGTADGHCKLAMPVGRTVRRCSVAVGSCRGTPAGGQPARGCLCGGVLTGPCAGSQGTDLS